jgi:hypothetical protein
MQATSVLLAAAPSGFGREVFGWRKFHDFLRESSLQPSTHPQFFLLSLLVLHLATTTQLTMPNTNIQTGQDWGAVNVGRSSAGRVAVPKTAHGVTRAKAMGILATVSFFVCSSFGFFDILFDGVAV